MARFCEQKQGPQTGQASEKISFDGGEVVEHGGGGTAFLISFNSLLGLRFDPICFTIPALDRPGRHRDGLTRLHFTTPRVEEGSPHRPPSLAGIPLRGDPKNRAVQSISQQSFRRFPPKPKSGLPRDPPEVPPCAGRPTLRGGVSELKRSLGVALREVASGAAGVVAEKDWVPVVGQAHRQRAAAAGPGRGGGRPRQRSTRLVPVGRSASHQTFF